MNDTINPYDRIADWVESLYIPASSIGDNKHIAAQIRGMKPIDWIKPPDLWHPIDTAPDGTCVITTMKGRDCSWYEPEVLYRNGAFWFRN